jgi:hypothetical protein
MKSYVTCEWSAPGYFGRVDCVCCGFTMLAENRVLTVRHESGRAEAKICDGCVNAISEMADGRQIALNGTELK